MLISNPQTVTLLSTLFYHPDFFSQTQALKSLVEAAFETQETVQLSIFHPYFHLNILVANKYMRYLL